MPMITVLHRKRNVEDRREAYVAVALVDIPEGGSDIESLEYAYRWTNNVMGSWSLREGEDCNERVTVIGTYHELDGKVFGLRSTMMDDMMILNGELWRVATMGFDKVESIGLHPVVS